MVVWPTADIEALFLRADTVLEEMATSGFAKAGLGRNELRARLDELIQAQEDNVVAELAQRLLRERASESWPSPRGDNALQRLRSSVASLTPADVEAAIGEAQSKWTASQGDLWTLVRGKRVLQQFTRDCTASVRPAAARGARSP